MVLYMNFFLLTSFSLPLVSWAWWDWPLMWLTNHHPSVLWHCWLRHLTCKIVSKMTCVEWDAKPYHTVPVLWCSIQWLIQLVRGTKKPHLAPQWQVLSPGEFNGMISHPLPRSSECFITISVTILPTHKHGYKCLYVINVQSQATKNSAAPSAALASGKVIIM